MLAKSLRRRADECKFVTSLTLDLNKIAKILQHTMESSKGVQWLYFDIFLKISNNSQWQEIVRVLVSNVSEEVNRCQDHCVGKSRFRCRGDDLHAFNEVEVRPGVSSIKLLLNIIQLQKKEGCTFSTEFNNSLENRN